jgi:hypothetical protein
MIHSLRIGVVFGLILTLINGGLELVPTPYANLVGLASAAVWMTCVGLAGALTYRRHPQASATLAAIAVVGVDSIRSAAVKLATGATAIVQNQPVHLTPGMIILVELVIFLGLALPAAGVGWLCARLGRVLVVAKVSP